MPRSSTLLRVCTMAERSLSEPADPRARIISGPSGPWLLFGSPDPAETSASVGAIIEVSRSPGASEKWPPGLRSSSPIMNNMMGEEDLNPGGHFSLAPGERLTSMMAPTLAEVSAGSGLPKSNQGPDGPEMILALGSAGSERLRSAIVQTLSNVLDRGMGLQQAVEAPRVHLTGNTVQVEPGVSDSAVQALVNAGYEVNRWPECDLYFGGVQAAAFWPSSSDRFDGGGDPRRGGGTSLAVTIT